MKPEESLIHATIDEEVAYVHLPQGGGERPKSARQVRLLDILEGYTGADVYFDLSEDNRLLGIEILL